MAEELMWFDNPPRRRSTTRRKPPKGFKSWKAWSASMRRRKKGGAEMASKRRRRSAPKATTSRRRHRVSAAPRRRRRHAISTRRAASHAGRVLRYRRRNPPNFFSGLPGRLMDAGIGAVEVTLGKAGARAIPTMLKLPADGAMGLATQLVSALVIGWLGSMVSPNMGKMLLIGGLTAPIEAFIKGANIPVISPALAGQDYFSVGGYPQPAPALAGYVQSPSLAAYEDDFAAYPQ
jgi:hypothetical protein